MASAKIAKYFLSFAIVSAYNNRSKHVQMCNVLCVCVFVCSAMVCHADKSVKCLSFVHRGLNNNHNIRTVNSTKQHNSNQIFKHTSTVTTIYTRNIC